MATSDFCYWDHLTDLESAQQFDAFTTYRELGPGRTFVRVAELHRLSYGTIVKWADLAAWRERAQEFDRAMVSERGAALEAARATSQAAWATRRAEIFNELESIVNVGASQLLHDLRNKNQRLRPNELRLIVETLTKWQNLANGDVTERLDLGVDLSKLSDTELEQYAQLLDKAQAPAEPDKE